MDAARATAAPSLASSLVRPLVLLAALLTVAWPLFAAYGFWKALWPGVVASLAAAAVCGGAAALALVVTVVSQQAQQPIGGILAGMLVRMAVPLLVLVALPSLDPSLTKTGLAEMLLGYYLVALVVETGLLVRLVPSATNVAKAA